MLITFDTAKAHLRVDGTDADALITLYISASELSAVEYLQRNIYADSSTLSAAMALVPASIASAISTYDAAYVLIDAMADGTAKDMAILMAEETYAEAKTRASMTYRGIVLNEQISAAILIGVSMLYDNPEASEQAAWALAKRSLLDPFRAY